MNTKDFLMAFDFDGVVWDTVDECFHVGYKVYKNFDGFINEKEEVLVRKIREARFLVKVAEDFYVIFHILKENPSYDFSSITFEYFYSLREQLKSRGTEFAKEFYRERKRMMEEERELWLSWQKPFSSVVEQLERIKENFLDFIICTNKDKKSVENLLSLYNLHYPVYGRDFSVNKEDILLKIVSEKSLKPDKVIFIDDIMENLLPVKKSGINVFMADWGYNNEIERKKALDAGIKVIGKENIIEQVREFI